MSVSTTPARGMRDFLPADVRRRQYVIGVVADMRERVARPSTTKPVMH